MNWLKKTLFGVERKLNQEEAENYLVEAAVNADLIVMDDEHYYKLCRIFDERTCVAILPKKYLAGMTREQINGIVQVAKLLDPLSSIVSHEARKTPRETRKGYDKRTW